MSEVTFTPEQVKEIRGRITKAIREGVIREGGCRLLAAFPLPKVTRYRTFGPTAGRQYQYRLKDGVVEFSGNGTDGWVTAGASTVAEAAEWLIGLQDWTALAALADVAARPTEEVEE